jgi:hypothetical protein
MNATEFYKEANKYLSLDKKTVVDKKGEAIKLGNDDLISYETSGTWGIVIIMIAFGCVCGIGFMDNANGKGITVVILLSYLYIFLNAAI